MISGVTTLSKSLLLSTVLGLSLSAFAFGAQAHDCDSRGRHAHRHHHHHHHGYAMRDGKVHAYAASRTVVKKKRHRHVTRAKVRAGERVGGQVQDQTKGKGQDAGKMQQPKATDQPKGKAENKK